MSRRAPYELVITDKIREILNNSYLTSATINEIIVRNEYEHRTVATLCAGLRKDLVDALVKEKRCPIETIEKSIGCPEDLDAVAFWLDDIRELLNTEVEDEA